MKTLLQIKEEIKMMVPKGLGSTFVRLEELLSRNSEAFSDVIQLKSQYKEAQKHFRIGTIEFERQATINNRIRFALLSEVVAKLEKRDFRDTILIKDDDAIQTFPPYDLKVPRYKKDVLRINRKDAARFFHDQSIRLKRYPVQHYFVYGDRHQQPRSFVERLIFELESAAEMIDYEPKGDKHIQVRDVELGGNLQISKLRLREYFSKRFGTDITRLSDITDGFSTEGQYSVIITALKLHVEEWEPWSFEFFRWLFSEFCQIDTGHSTRFMFFYIIQKDTMFERFGKNVVNWFTRRPNRQKLAEKTLDRIKNFPNCTVLPELKPISRHDLAVWLEEFISNEAEVDKLITEITADTKTQTELDMSFVENKLVHVLEKVPH